MHNRLPLDPGDQPERRKFPASILKRSIGEKLIEGAHGAKIEIRRFTDDDGNSEAVCEFELTGHLTRPNDARWLLRELEREFTSPGEGGEVDHD